MCIIISEKERKYLFSLLHKIWFFLSICLLIITDSMHLKWCTKNMIDELILLKTYEHCLRMESETTPAKFSTLGSVYFITNQKVHYTHEQGIISVKLCWKRILSQTSYWDMG